jgi:hypothetical protein
MLTVRPLNPPQGDKGVKKLWKKESRTMLTIKVPLRGI